MDSLQGHKAMLQQRLPSGIRRQDWAFSQSYNLAGRNFHQNDGTGNVVMHLWSEFYLSRPMFAETQLDGLQSVINDLLPEWSNGLHAAKDEDSSDTSVLGRVGRLYDGIHLVAPPRRGLGQAMLTGGYCGLSFFLGHCEGTLPPELNEMTVEVYELATVEGQAPPEWARKFFEAVALQLPVRYGHVRTSDEFDTKNMIRDESGVRAVGRLLAHELPGLYWLNYFGAPYVDLIGRERLLASPAHEVKPVGGGVLIALDSTPEAWQTTVYRRCEEATIAHLGRQYFFSRHDPQRKTVAPDFRAGVD